MNCSGYELLEYLGPIGALYHPPRAQYSTHSLLNYIEACLDELTHQEPTATIVLAGDFNQLSDR